MNKLENYEFEKKLYQDGFELIAGIDEVGRGPLAGPVVAAAVIMPKNCYIEGVTDSKKLSEKKRKEYKEIILNEALAVGIAFIDEKVIDNINIYEATKVAMKNAIDKLSVKPDFVLIDAMPLDLNIPSMSIIKGDLKSFTISCASIIAKEARDDYMREISLKYPEYHFEKHKGYPTKQHIEAVKKYGVLDFYRKSFKPISNIIKEQNNDKICN